MKQTICIIIGFLMTSYTLAVESRIEGLSYLDHTPIALDISHGKIVGISRPKTLSQANKGLYIAPGLIDNQVNGYAGVSFALGGGTLSLEGIHKATRAQWKVGVTSFLPTLTTNDQALLKRHLSLLDEAKNDPALRGSIVGFHLEGPYISPVDGFRGAHPRAHVRKPNWEEFMELYHASGENILQMTIAPDIENALELIRKCRELGVVIAIGHHNANREQIDAAVDNGAVIATHLGNGCANMINRHRNPLWPQLANDRLMISIIGDGFHLLTEEIKTFYRVKGTHNTIITSDVTSYAGLPQGEYTTLDGDRVEITAEGMLRHIAQGGLYGSASPLIKGVGNVMQVTGCSLAQAIQMASTNPARLNNLDDRGALDVGMRADLILFRLQESKLTIQKTIIAGDVVYSLNR